MVDTSAMDTSMFRFLTLPCGVALLGLAVVPGCRRPQAPPPMGPPIVQVSKPLQRDVPLVAQAIAQTEAIANVEVRARVEATVEKILFVEGTSVREGDPLFLLDKKPIEQRLAAAKGNLGQLEANLGRVTQDVERLRPLAGRGAVSKADLDTAIANQKQAEAALETGRAQVRAAELDLGYTEVAAPVSGVIGAKQVDVGSLVGKGQPTVMATISPLDPIWANLEISEVAYLNNAERFRQAESSPIFALVLANGQPHPHLGRLAFVDRVINATTGTLKVRVEFPNPAKILRPGQFCHVRVLSRVESGALLLPQRAVQELQSQHSVFVVGADGRAAFRQVTMGRRIGSLWIVESGLTAEDTVIIEGVLKARDGAPVTARPGTIEDTSLKELEATVPGGRPGAAEAPPTPPPSKPAGS